MSTRTCYHTFLSDDEAEARPRVATPSISTPRPTPTSQWLEVEATLRERAQNIEKRVEISSSEQLVALRKKVRADKGL
ncbi:hypothetical protein JCM19000A_42380 [Silvimonas sp. JCM 19000]